MKRRLIITAVLALLALTVATTAQAAKKPRKARKANAPTQLVVPAFTQESDVTLPATGLYNVSAYDNLAGFIGLQAGSGEVTFTWYNDPAGEQITGVQGMPLHGSIPSLALPNITNQGDYLRVRFQCIPVHNPGETYGPCSAPFTMRLFGTNRHARDRLAAPDTNLYGEGDTLPAHTSRAYYPTDYWAGHVRFWLEAPAGFTLTLYQYDLTLVPYVMDRSGPGGLTTTMPFGAWFVVVSNTTDTAGSFTISGTPDLTAKLR
jgi:hypothetical protein